MSEQNHYIYEFGPFRLDTQKRLLLRAGAPVKLFPKEFDMLLALVERSGEALDKDQLMQRVWGETVVEESNLTSNISHLRKALGEKPDQHEYIVTVPGQGYRFVAGVRAANFDEVFVHERTQGAIEQEVVEAGAVSSLPASTLDSSILVRSFKRHRAAVVIGSFFVLAAAVTLFIFAQRPRSERRKAVPPIPFQQITIKQLTTNSKATLAALSPDGKLFVYTSRVSGKEGLFLGYVEGGEPVELRPPADGAYLSLKFSPDGGAVYYVVIGGEYPAGALCKVPAFGGVPEELRQNVNTRVAFAPNMKQFAYVRSDAEKRTSSLVIANTHGAGEQEIVSRPEHLPFRSFSPSWSPDGKTIAAGAVNDKSGGYEIFVVSAADSQIRPLTASAWNEVLGTVWLPDGNGLAVIAREKDAWERSQIWHVSYPGGAARRIVHDLDNYNSATISLSSDGQSLLALQTQNINHIWVAPAANLSQPKRITLGSIGRRDGWGNLDWTPDGKLLYGATVRESVSLWMMDADGDNQKQLTSAGYVDYFLSSSDDGRYMVFESNRSGETEIWRARLDGSDLKRLTTGGNSAEPSVSPDGKWVVYTASRDGLRTIWRVSIEGGEPVRLADKPASSPRISPDGKLIACGYNAQPNSRTQLAILPIEGGQPAKLFDVPRRIIFTYGIRWTPDGKALSYRDPRDGVWRQPIEGGEPKRIEGLPEGKVVGHAWSKDGKQFAFTSEPALRDVVLIRDLR